MTRTPQTEHDVVIVGARCAGAATGMLLARMGHDVAVVDRATFPSDTLSTHSIARSGVVQLHRWGLLDRVLQSGAPAIRQVSFQIGEDTIVRQIKCRAGVDLLVAPRRHMLDHLLVGAASDAGAAVRTGISVTDVTTDDTGRANGVSGTDADGRAVHLRARVVIGADGLRSRVARSVAAPMIDERHRNGSILYTYAAGLGAEGSEFHLGPGLFAGVFPTHPEPGHTDVANLWVCGPDRLVGPAGGTGDRTERFLELLRAASPTLADRASAGVMTAPIRGFRRMPNQLRQAAGRGWALVGDAGYFRDAVTGHGISDAFRDAEFLANTVDRGLAAGHDLDADLADYAAGRDAHVREIFDLTCALAEYPPIEQFADRQKALSSAIEAEAQMLADLPATRLAASECAA